MRASSLSNDAVLELINGYFVPVYIPIHQYTGSYPNLYFEPPMKIPAEEKAEMTRIWNSFADGKSGSVGTVAIWLLTPDAQPIFGMHAGEAMHSEKLIPVLQSAIKKGNYKKGSPPVPPAKAAKAPAGSLTLHLVSRSLDNIGVWGGFPGENWIVLSAAKAKELAPPSGEVGTEWTVGKDVTWDILKFFYPQLDQGFSKGEIPTSVSLRGSVVSSDRAKLTGSIRMEHPNAIGKIIEATLVGYVDFDAERRAVRSLRLVTENGAFNGGKFGVALRSFPQ